MNPPVYADAGRHEMLTFVPEAATTVLDVGCWRGGFGAALKAARPHVVVTGIEPFPDAAGQAATRLDRVIVGLYPEVLPAGERFDCIVFNDVLEHMADPWETLKVTSGRLNPGGRIVASLPNVRHWNVVWSLLRAGTWTYREEGILDRTHLRFFTRSSMVDLFASCGYRVERMEPVVQTVSGRMAKLVAALGRRTEEFRTKQYGVRARLAGEA